MHQVRFIPVCTGNTVCLNGMGQEVSVYPCVYREHTHAHASIASCAGLSLCVQGTPKGVESSHLSRRFIPVCTGNTASSQACNTASTVYPCVYREHAKADLIGEFVSGLSLCVQGTLHFVNQGMHRFRFIPVCTGNTSPSSKHSSIISVYPCVYREHDDNLVAEPVKLGLSLCVQGTHSANTMHLVLIRFIPVCTGNTPIITYCFIIKILTTKFLPIF